MKSLVSAAALALALLITTEVESQTATAKRTRLDINVGLGHGGGGKDVRRERRGVSTSGVLTRSVRVQSRSAWIGLSGRRFDLRDNTDDCQGSIDACFSRYPRLSSIGVVAGHGIVTDADLQHRIRILGGPSYVWTDDGKRGAAGELRLDAWLLRTQHLSLTLALDAAVIPLLKRATFWTGGAGLGIGLRR